MNPRRNPGMRLGNLLPGGLSGPRRRLRTGLWISHGSILVLLGRIFPRTPKANRNSRLRNDQIGLKWCIFPDFPLDPAFPSATLNLPFRWVARPAVSFLAAEEVPCGYFGTSTFEAL